MSRSEADGLAAALAGHLRAGTSEDRERNRWLLPATLCLKVPPAADPGMWDTVVRRADRDACRAWRRHLLDEWGDRWTVVVPDLHAAIHVDAQLHEPRVCDTPPGGRPVVEVVVPAVERTAMAMAVAGASEIHLLTAGLTFGSGPAAAAVYRGPGMANVDAIALQVLDAGPDQATLLVVDRRGVTVRRPGLLARTQQVPHRATVTVAAGDRIVLGPVTLEVS